jgi:hypothetical protein
MIKQSFHQLKAMYRIAIKKIELFSAIRIADEDEDQVEPEDPQVLLVLVDGV